MANVSKINFNNETLDIKDTYAREQLAHLTADNYTADVAGDYTVNAGDIAMTSKNATLHTTADRTIDTDGSDSVHIDGASTLNVGGLRTETFAGDKTESVTGTTTEKFANINTTVTGKWIVNLPDKKFNMKDIALQADVKSAVNAETMARENADTKLNNRIDSIIEGRKRVIIALGDSLGAGIMSPTTRSDYGWLYKLREMAATDLTIYTNLDVVIPGNSGFASTAPFLAQIKQMVSTSSIDTNEVTDIVIFSGTNDCPFIDTTLGDALDEFLIYVKTTFPNAAVKLGVLIAAYGSAKIGTGNSLMHQYRSHVEKYGYRYIPDVFNLCLRKKYLQSDSTHLNEAGYKTIYPYILECALNGSTQYSFYGYNTYAHDVMIQYYISENGIGVSLGASNDSSATYIGGISITNSIAQIASAPSEENILPIIPYTRFCPVLVSINNEWQIGDYYLDNNNGWYLSLTGHAGAPSPNGTAVLTAGASVHFIPLAVIS